MYRAPLRGRSHKLPHGWNESARSGITKIVESVANDLFSRADVAFLATPVPAEMSAMPPSDWQLLQSDFNRGRAVALATLQLKTSFWGTLPWLLCGLAHSNANTVREVARKALAAWQADPRSEGHHPLTQQFFSEPLLGWIQKLVDGVDLRNLPDACRFAVCELCFVPVVETTIEAKHSRATLTKGLSKVGPVGLSLSNRAPMLERWLRTEACNLEEVLHHFNITCSMKGAVRAANLETHPAFQKKKETESADRTHLTRAMHRDHRQLMLRLLYQCDIDTMYTDMRKAKHVIKEAQRAKGRLAGTLMLKRTCKKPMPQDLHGVKALTLMEHFLTVLEEGAVYSCNSGLLRLYTLDSVLHVPLTKRLRAEEDLEVEVVDDGSGPSSSFFLQVVLVKPNKKVLQVPVSASGKLATRSTLVLQRPLLHQVSANEVILGDCQDATASQLSLVIEAIEGNSETTPPIWKWTSQELAWHLPGAAGNDGQRRFLSRLVGCGAGPQLPWDCQRTRSKNRSKSQRRPICMRREW